MLLALISLACALQPQFEAGQPFQRTHGAVNGQSTGARPGPRAASRSQPNVADAEEWTPLMIAVDSFSEHESGVVREMAETANRRFSSTSRRWMVSAETVGRA